MFSLTAGVEVSRDRCSDPGGVRGRRRPSGAPLPHVAVGIGGRVEGQVLPAQGQAVPDHAERAVSEEVRADGILRGAGEGDRVGRCG